MKTREENSKSISKYKLIRKGRTISRDLTVCLVLVVAVVSIITTSLSYLAISRKGNRQLEQKADEYIAYLIESLEFPIWHLDKESVKKTGESYIDNELFAVLLITEPNGDILFENVKKNEKDLIKREGKVIHNGRFIGHIKIGLTTRLYKEGTRQLLWTSILTMLFIILALAGVTRLLLRVFLKSPLDDLIQGIDRIAKGEYGYDFHEAKQREIETIISRFNYMAEKIKGREKSLSEVNRRLENEILEHKLAQELLRESEARYRHLLDASPDPVVVYDPEGKTTYINPTFEQVYGWSREELLGERIDFVPLHEAERTQVAIESMLRGESDLFETQRLTKDGKLLDVQLKSAILRESKGILTGSIITHRDITERKKAEDALKKSEERYRDIFKTAAVSIWEEDFTAVKAAIDDLKSQGVTDFQKYLVEHPEFVIQASKMVKVVDINETTISMFGAKSKEEMLGSLDKVFLPESLDTFRDEIVAMAEGKTYFEIEGVNQTLQGERLNILMTISFPSEAEKFRSVLVSIMDITERKRAEEALKDYSERLEEMVKERTHELEAAHEEIVKREKLSVLGRMTAMVSHELRNPLGVIHSSAYYLKSKLGGADEKILKHLQRIDQQVGHCDSIVDELLEYTRSRSSVMDKGDMTPWIEEVLDQMTIPDQVSLVRKLSPDLPIVRFDGEKLRRVVINLVDNALQAVMERQERKRMKDKDDPYQPQVKVSASVVEDGVCIEMEDNGIGMDEETVNQAFEALFTTKARGTGLGLAIVKKIIEEHGGSVTLKSEPDRGTKVFVKIPLLTRQQEQADGK